MERPASQGAPDGPGRADDAGPPPIGRALTWLLLFAGATALGLIDASQLQYDRALQDDPVSWGHALGHGLPRWYAWVALMPLVLGVTRRVARSGLGTAGALAAHLGAGVVIVVAHVVLLSVVNNALHGAAGPLADLRPAFQKYMALTYLGGLVTYALIVAGWYAVDLVGRYRDRERAAARLDVQASELKALLAEARLRHLQAQLHPHFLFNALHALSDLVLRGETRDAVRMTARLGELLRRSLGAAEEREIALGDELRLLDGYLEIQRIRFEGRLRVAIDIEEGAERALVPPLLLQPLAENAIRHGIEEDPAAGVLEIAARREGDSLVLEVADDGPGPGAGTGAEGVGLGNTRARLRGLHGDAAGIELLPREGGGARVRVRLPFRTPPSPERAGAGTVAGSPRESDGLAS